MYRNVKSKHSFLNSKSYKRNFYKTKYKTSLLIVPFNREERDKHFFVSVKLVAENIVKLQKKVEIVYLTIPNKNYPMV